MHTGVDQPGAVGKRLNLYPEIGLGRQHIGKGGGVVMDPVESGKQGDLRPAAGRAPGSILWAS